MKRVLIIEASPRKGFSTLVAEQIRTMLSPKAKVEVIKIRDLNILPCKGCCQCLSKGSSFCPNREDDVKVVLRKIEESEGVVVIVPNYSLQITGLLKHLFDRLGFVFHRPRLFGKTCLPIVVQGVYGGNKIIKYINEVFSFWGMKTVKGAVLTGGLMPNKPQAKEIVEKNQACLNKSIERFLKEIYIEKPRSPSLFKTLIFRMTRTSLRYSEEALSTDKKYYETKGWYNSPYYYPVKLNPIYLLVGNIVDLFIKSKVEKGGEKK